MRLVIFTDPHLREKEPYYTATRKALMEVLEILQPDDLLVCLGDFFDKSTLTGKLAARALTFWQSVKETTGRTGVCLTGNHDRSTRWGNALSMFGGEEFMAVVSEPGILTIDDIRIGVLPHLMGRQMQDTYPALLRQLNTEGLTAVFGHFSADPLFGDEVDASALTTCPLILGHIHTTDTDRYVGPLTPTRYSERDIHPRVVVFDPKTGRRSNVRLDTELKYIELVYGDPTTAYVDAAIYTITGAPSARAAREMYPHVVIREVQVVSTAADTETAQGTSVDRRDILREFLSTVENEAVVAKLRKVVGIPE